MRRKNLAAAAALALGLAAGATAQAPEAAMGWPEAAELLQRERLSAEVCVRVTKRFLPAGDMAALSEAELQYEAGRTEFNSVITSLQVALTDKAEAPALATVEARAAAGTEARRAFCDKAAAMAPPPKPGEKGLIAEVLSGSVGEVIKAAVTVWERLRDDDALRRASLNTALEDAKWPAFADIGT